MEEELMEHNRRSTDGSLSAFEGHFVPFAMVALLSLNGWMLLQIHNQSVDQERFIGIMNVMSQKIETLQQTISRMGTDSYTARDAKRDQMLANERINRLKVRVDRLELKVEEK